MSDSDNDRKRKASEIDSTAVAPKKKLAAQAALAAAEAAEKDSVGSAKTVGGSVTVKSEHGAKPSYSVEHSAPAGAHPADSEEVVKFQRDRLAAALEVGLSCVASGGAKLNRCLILRECSRRKHIRIHLRIYWGISAFRHPCGV